MREKTNCPNCGAPINSTVCQYCGTAFYDFATLDDERPTYVQIKINGHLFMCRARLTELIVTNAHYELPSIDMSFDIYADDDGIMFRRMEYGETK